MLPLAEALAQRVPKIQDGSLVNFLNRLPDLEDWEVGLGTRRFEILIATSSICTLVGFMLLTFAGKNKIDYVARTGITKEQLSIVLNFINIPLELFTLDDGGMQALDAALFAKPNKSSPIMDRFGQIFGKLLQFSYGPIDMAVELLQLFRQLPAEVKNLRMLPRPRLLTEPNTLKAAVRLSQSMKNVHDSPLCNVQDIQLCKYTSLHVALEGRQHDPISIPLWEILVKEYLFTGIFLTFLTNWRSMENYAEPPSRSVPVKVFVFFRTLMLGLGGTGGMTRLETFKMLVSPHALKLMETTGLELLEYSKERSLSEEERSEFCFAATSLLCFRTIIEAVGLIARLKDTGFSTLPTNLLKSLAPLSQAWVLCVHCSCTFKIDRIDYQKILGSMVTLAIRHVGHMLLAEIERLKSSSNVTEKEFIALYTAQEAISTMVYASLWLFTTSYTSNKRDFILTKKPLLDIVPPAVGIMDMMTRINTVNLEQGVVTQNAAVCEAGVKAVEAATKALLWSWNTSPIELQELDESAKIDPSNDVSGWGWEDLKDDLSIAVVMHRLVGDTLRPTLWSAPLYKNSTPSGASAKLAKKVGAVALKAFYAMESKPHDD